MPDARCYQSETGEASLSEIFLCGNKEIHDIFSWGFENLSFELGENITTGKISHLAI